MIPLKDHNPTRIRPVVTWTLIALNIAAFALSAAIGPGAAADRFVFEFALVPAKLTDGADLHALVTHMFLHGGLLHLGFNMLFLWIFGDNLEEAFGRLRFVLFYLGCGVLAGLTHYAFSPALSTTPMLGASGAVAGVMGGYLLLFPRTRVDVALIIIVFVHLIRVPAWMMLGFWFALQLAFGVFDAASGGGVAYWAHAGGFAAGLLLTLPVWLARGATRSWRGPLPVIRKTTVPRVARQR